MTDLTHEKLKSIFNYNPLNGSFTYIIRVSGKMPGTTINYYPKDRYKVIIIEKQKYYAHRLAWFYMTGEWPKKWIDHKNGNKSDNRWANLRLASKTENGCNRKISKNSSGIKGVSFCKRTGKWQAQIKFKKKSHHLGRFSKIEDAEKVVREMRIKLHKEFTNHG